MIKKKTTDGGQGVSVKDLVLVTVIPPNWIEMSGNRNKKTFRAGFSFSFLSVSLVNYRRVVSSILCSHLTAKHTFGYSLADVSDPQRSLTTSIAK